MPLRDSQLSHTQHAVPQNIMDVEFKLIGDLTMRQFIYLAVFGLAAFLVLRTGVGFFKWPLVLGLAILGLALAFVPVQDRGLDEWIVAFLKAVYMPTQRVWAKELVLPSAFTYQNIAVVKQEMITLAPTSSRRKLEEYLEMQHDKEPEDYLDIPEKEYIMKVRQAFAPTKKTVDIFESVSPSIHNIPQKSPLDDQKKNLQEEQKIESVTITQHPIEPHEKKKDKFQLKPKIVQTSSSEDLPLMPLTPDMHSGRKFTRVLPSEGRLILPVRGETVLQTSDELEIEEDLAEKTKQLQQLLDQIKMSESKSKGVVQEQQIPSVKDNTQKNMVEAKTVVKEIKTKNEELTNEIEKVKNEVAREESPKEEKIKKEALLKRLRKDKEKASKEYTDLQHQVSELHHKIDNEKKKAEKEIVKATYAEIDPITNTPNIVSGIVKDQDGKALQGVILLIKNHRGESVRALKSNTLGQFAISTPLMNGVYTLEVGSTMENMVFDIITIEVKGEVIPPLELMGKKL